MDAVGPDRVGDIDAVVNDEVDAGCGCQLPESLTKFDPVLGGCALLTELDGVNAALDRGLDDRLRRATFGEGRLRHKIGAPLIGIHECHIAVIGKRLTIDANQ
jgi:hypothetical protein